MSRLYEFMDISQATSQLDIVKDLILKNCKPYLREIKGKDFMLYRGLTNRNYEVWTNKKVRTDRRPVDMKIYVHEVLNKAFEKMFGWKARSEGVFVTPDGSWTPNYDDMFFPIGQFKYIWSSKVSDLWKDLYNKKNMNDIDEYIRWLKIMKYTDKGMTKNLDSEMMIKCKEYYLIHQDYYINIEGWLRKL